MNEFIVIIIIGFAVLQIAFLVKIWKMTEDVATIKKQIIKSERIITTSDAVIARFTAESDSLYSILITKLINKLNDEYRCYVNISKAINSGEKVDNHYMEESQKRASDIILKAKKLCKVMDRNLPSELSSLDNYVNFMKEIKHT